MKNAPKKVVIAAGGTGGHLFPAQALARDLQENDPSCCITFMGKGLAKNAFFHRELFAYKDIESASLKRPVKFLLFFFKGIWQAYFTLKKIKPSVVVGFGSFHVFPVLVAATLRRIPLVLFESNSFPGRVNRLFSKVALFSGVQFPSAKKYMKGKCIEVEMPLWSKLSRELSKKNAASYFSLKEDLFTFLVFGGSQGAKAINVALLGAFCHLASRGEKFQVIHLVGAKTPLEEVQGEYERIGVLAAVKSFEEKMDLAWTLADTAICRAGASTLAELMLFEVPALLIPYPHAAEDHQLKNGTFLQEEVGGGLVLEEKTLSVESLESAIDALMDPIEHNARKQAMKQFKEIRKVKTLVSLVEELFS